MTPPLPQCLSCAAPDVAYSGDARSGSTGVAVRRPIEPVNDWMINLAPVHPCACLTCFSDKGELNPDPIPEFVAIPGHASCQLVSRPPSDCHQSTETMEFRPGGSSGGLVLPA